MLDILRYKSSFLCAAALLILLPCAAPSQVPLPSVDFKAGLLGHSVEFTDP